MNEARIPGAGREGFRRPPGRVQRAQARKPYRIWVATRLERDQFGVLQEHVENGTYVRGQSRADVLKQRKLEKKVLKAARAAGLAS